MPVPIRPSHLITLSNCALSDHDVSHHITPYHTTPHRVVSRRIASCRDSPLAAHARTQITLNLLAQIIPGTILPGNPLANMVRGSRRAQSIDRSRLLTPFLPLFFRVFPRVFPRSRLSSPRLLSCRAPAALVDAAWFLSRCCASVRASAEQVFKGYSVQTLTESTSFVQDLKLGHYIKVPPRATFVGASSSLSIRRMRSRLLTCAHAVRTLCICFLCICFLLCFFWGAARQCNWWPRSWRRFCRWG